MSALVRLGVSGYNRTTAMAAPRVTVYRTTDPIQADMLGALLRENGIAACVLGTRHGAAIGVGQHILALHIEVPQAQAGAATDFLEAFFDSDGAALLAEHAGFAPDDGSDDAFDDGSDDGSDDGAANGSDDGTAAHPGAAGRAPVPVAIASRARGAGTWALAAGVIALVLGALLVAIAALAGALRTSAPVPAPAPVPAVQPAH